MNTGLGVILYLRQHKKWMFYLSLLMVVVFSGVIGYRLAQNEPRIGPSPTDEDIPAGADDERISAGARVTWQIEYKMCGHCMTSSNAVDHKMAGLTFTQLAENYPDVRILFFSPDNIELKKSFACYCPDHFILKKHDDGFLAVLRTAAGTDNSNVYQKLPIKFNEIEKTQQAPLEAGRVFSSLSDLQAYLERLHGR